MKNRWLIAGCAAALLGFTGGVASARTNSQDHQAQEKREDHRFNDHDKQAAHDWVGKHHDNLPAGFRAEDKLTPELEARLTVGVVLDRDLRGRIRPVPEDLLATLTPAPAGYRYVIIGDHIVLVDEGWHVHDIIHLEVGM
jgi:hypothetical protein